LEKARRVDHVVAFTIDPLYRFVLTIHVAPKLNTSIDSIIFIFNNLYCSRDNDIRWSGVALCPGVHAGQGFDFSYSYDPGEQGDGQNLLGGVGKVSGFVSSQDALSNFLDGYMVGSANGGMVGSANGGQGGNNDVENLLTASSIGADVVNSSFGGAKALAKDAVKGLGVAEKTTGLIGVALGGVDALISMHNEGVNWHNATQFGLAVASGVILAIPGVDVAAEGLSLVVDFFSISNDVVSLATKK